MNTYLKRGLEGDSLSFEFKAGLVIYRSNKLDLYPSDEEIASALKGILPKSKVDKALYILWDWDIARIHDIRESGDSHIKEYEINPELLLTFEKLDGLANSMSIEN